MRMNINYRDNLFASAAYSHNKNISTLCISKMFGVDGLIVCHRALYFDVFYLYSKMMFFFFFKLFIQTILEVVGIIDDI